VEHDQGGTLSEKAMKLDPEVLAEYSTFVEEEGDVEWVNVPLSAARARELALDPWWTRCLTAKVTTRECVSRLWTNLKDVLPRTVAGLAKKTSALAILKTAEKGVSLVYFIGDIPDGEVRRGYAPAHELPDISKVFPIDLKPFYQLHDGFVDFMTDDSGLLPTRAWITVPDRRTGKPSLVKVVMEGSEAFGFDVSESPCRAYLLQPDSGDVELVTDPWEYLDDLMATSIEEM
jgi:hypothetical protein